ncbi:uncharacterized protein RSE6_03493 [Rhynchosporium secalis]|uniref:Uncharacterized protein n=1 Tax=Rhynchosporium secalis TaxID=38038 RepID=A0A1E1M2X6_RHYSE|nr:uncharacterized protein RSE6_03493 [Rhynchosporium secalis]
MECAKCKKTSKFACGQCDECPMIEGDMPIVHYCSAKCQKVDSANHQPSCQRLQEYTWCKFQLDAIEKYSSFVILRGQEHDNCDWLKDYKVFPSHLVSSTEDRETLLSYRSCREASIWVIELVDGFLKGKSSIAQVDFKH